jgi:hypothetical protein
MTGRLAAVMLLMAVPAAAQAPVINAVLERRTPAQTLAREIDAVVQRGTATWIGYRVPMATRPGAGVRQLGWHGQCRLEPPSDLVVLIRAAARAITEVRALPVDCDVDAAGMPLVWLDPVAPAQSVAWLSGVLGEVGRPANALEPTLMAIALHADHSAVDLLVRTAQNGESRLRARALFWLAQRAAAEALPAIDAALERDPDTAVKRQAVFALAQFPDGEGVPRLIELARTHANAEVRRQAMFWLGQSRDPRATAFFAQLLDR